LEHTGFTGGGVEFVCDAHIDVATAHGYRPPRELGKDNCAARRRDLMWPGDGR
jgi:hypothetical protein